MTNLVAMSWLVRMGGAEGIRTPDPLTASQVRYQLRHSPSRSPWSLHGAPCNRTRARSAPVAPGVPAQPPPAFSASSSQSRSPRSATSPFTSTVGVPRPCGPETSHADSHPSHPDLAPAGTTGGACRRGAGRRSAGLRDPSGLRCLLPALAFSPFGTAHVDLLIGRFPGTWSGHHERRGYP